MRAALALTLAQNDWGQTVLHLKQHLVDSLQVFYATTHVLDTTRNVLRGTTSLLAEGEALRRLADDHMPPDVSARIGSAQSDMMREEVQRYASACKRLIAVLRDNEELQSALQNHERFANRLSVASQRYVRYLSSVARHIPRAPPRAPSLLLPCADS